jgi:hypothetical protein
MKRQSFAGVVVLGAFLVVSTWISPAVGGINKLSGDERPVIWADDQAAAADERPGGRWADSNRTQPSVAAERQAG